MPEKVITKIIRQKGARHRVSIHLDGEFAFGASEEIVYEFRLAKGMSLPGATIEQIRCRDEFLRAKADAMRFLARRLHSVAELRKKLLRKKWGEDVIGEVVAHLESIRQLDDTRFARSFVHDRMLMNPLGRCGFQRELKKRGVRDDVIADVLNEMIGDEGEREAAFNLARRYMPRIIRLEPVVQVRRLSGYLRRRGFSTKLMREVVDQIVNLEAVEG